MFRNRKQHFMRIFMAKVEDDITQEKEEREKEEVYFEFHK